MAERLLVVGGDAGGMGAAMQVRRRQPYLEIVAIEKTAWTSYSACGIPYVVSGDIEPLERLVVRSPAEFREKHRIDVRTNHEVVALDLDAGRAEVRDHAHGRTITIPFDRLHLGTGARPVRPEIPGIELEMVRGVQTLDDAAGLLELARVAHARQVVIVGAGYIGLEMAEAFVRRGAEVTVLDNAEQVMRTLDPDMAVRVEKAMRGIGVDVRLATEVEGFEPGTVITSNGPVAGDLVVLGLGVVPNSELAADAGIETGARRAIAVNRRQQTSRDGVYAAGDCCETFHLVSQRKVHVALGTVANKAARVAGINLGGGYATFPGVVGTAITRVCDIEIARTGLSEAEATRDGFEHVTATIDATTRAGYFPDTKPIRLKLLAERGTRRLLGAQIVGEEGAAKRIDVLATCLHARLTIDQIIDLDLAYAPPFSGVWDAVHIAARRVAGELDR